MDDVRERSIYRDTWAEVDLEAIETNVKNMITHLGSTTKVMAVVKANAYGHGDAEVATAALRAGATHLAVATLDEAVVLRRKGITAPLLVLGWTRPHDVKTAAVMHIALTAFQPEWVKQAAGMLEDAPVCNIHIKIDTGMGRIGLRHREEFADFATTLNVYKSYFYVEGLYTHFATADEEDDTFLSLQRQRFADARHFFHLQGIDPLLVHSENSAAGLQSPERSQALCRLGISMYGLSPSEWVSHHLPFPLQPALSLYTKIIAVKQVNAGDTIGYGATYTAAENEYIATLPIGYADGWLRKMNGYTVLINGEEAPIVGRVCMDQCMISVKNKPSVGDVVTLIGYDGNRARTVDDVAKQLDTINYEVPCLLSLRVPRIF
ncbi:alanine racemase [Bacillaceae bacterium SIJ1]|uniref:alanine racemase n=1 Tax=Litoribacterium kuwaitense TaxID=1398745 RepID=UPI0013EC7F69|nr:alanine racemase [Litoribacterium kuwaitense]NGP46251.1 alanine racemase [Litoribacterium kuwaitense]